MTFLQIMGLLGPVIILLVSLALVPLTRWQDERERRRRAAKEAASHRH
jgi:hypothetical protein